MTVAAELPRAARRTCRSDRIVRRPWLLALALAVALLQSLGVAHRMAHAAQGLAGVPQIADAAHRAGSGHDAAGLFGGHAAGDGACLAFDHAALGDADLGVPALPVPALPPAMSTAWQPAMPALAAQASGHLARGPPAFA